MKILKRIMAGFACGIVMLGSNSVQAQNNLSTLPLIDPDIIEDSVKDVSDVIQNITDDINIQPEKTQSSYVYAREPESYTQVYYSEPVYEEKSLTLTYDEFMSMYGNQPGSEDIEQTEPVLVPADTGDEQSAYDKALADYNLALAQYEAACQMIESTKEVEVEVTEEVTDDQGNVTLVTRTELQTVTEQVPAGDVAAAQANLDTASSALESARQALDAVQSQTTIVEQPQVEDALPNQTTIVESESEQQEIIEEDVEVIEEVTHATSGTCGENLTWTLSDGGHLIISGTGDMTDFSGLIQPQWGHSITKITINNGVTSIGNQAFQKCYFTNISIPESVKRIGEYAFSQCTNLISISIPDGVTSIGGYAFSACTNLKTITIPKSCTKFGYYVFTGCEKLKTAGPTGSGCNYEFGWDDQIPDYAFHDCTSLTSIKIPSSAFRIGSAAFHGCSSLKSITIPDSIEQIEMAAFADCTGLTSIMIPNSIVYIEYNLFWGCTGLTEVILPESVKYIEDSAFRECTGLTSITIPYSVERIGESAFYNTHTTIYYYGTEEEWNNIEIHEDAIPADTIIYYLGNYSGKIRLNNGIVYMSNVFSNFLHSAYDYDHEIAKYAAGLSTLVYCDDTYIIEDGLKRLGYIYLEDNYAQTKELKNYRGDYSPVIFGLHYIPNLEATIVAAVIRGTYNEEWLTNFDIGDRDNHKSFEQAAKHVYSHLYSYIQSHSGKINGTLKILVTGHSRGAATANLVGAYLDNPYLFDLDHILKIETENVYTYTFATPNTTSLPVRYDSQFDNIFNIVNPEDFVTKVVPSAWGYGRFGKTLVLPSETSMTTRKYHEYLEFVNSRYEKYDEGEIYKPYPNGMYDVSEYVRDVTSEVSNVFNYYNKSLGNAGTLYDLYHYGLGGLLSKDSDYEGLAGSYIGNAALGGYGTIGVQTVDFFLSNGVINEYFADAHLPETYLAMVNSIAGEREYQGVCLYNIVNCPVDISIYDSTGTLVGQIINNEVQPGNEIWMYVDGDSKIYSLPDDDTYRVEFSGNDIGAMDYSTVLENMDSYEQQKAYHEGLELTTEKVYITDNTSEYKVLITDETEIEPTAEFDSETGKQLKVDVTVQGRGSAPSLENLTPGDYVTLKAATDSNNEFYGWYNTNGELVSAKAEYSFSIHNDISFIAKFSNVFVSANSMKFEKQSVTIANQENYYNKLTIGPENATIQKIEWKSSDESIVTVDNGMIRGMKAGSAKVTATLTDGTLSASYNVKVLPFEDVPQDAWYFSTAMECYETGLINGTSATTFSPMQEMTRAMVVTILWRMDGQPATAFNNKFKDVSSKQWYATSISWAVNNGVVNGYGDGTFKPDAAVTREQVAVMLANYATYKGVYVPGTKKLNTYPDGSQVSKWAQAGMKWALTNGIVSGNGEGYLRPKKSATRAEGAAMLLRMKNWL